MGDAEVLGVVEDVLDPDLPARFAKARFAETGFDLRGSEFEQLFAASVVGAEAVDVGDGHMDVTLWREGEAERVERKH